MQVQLSSGDYNIVDSGIVYLFHKSETLKLEIRADSGFQFIVLLRFVSDSSEEQNVKREVTENMITLTCVNFENSGTGLVSPAKLAIVDGKQLYLMFWSYIEGKGNTRSVKYTIFWEK